MVAMCTCYPTYQCKLRIQEVFITLRTDTFVGVDLDNTLYLMNSGCIIIHSLLGLWLTRGWEVYHRVWGLPSKFQVTQCSEGVSLYIFMSPLKIILLKRERKFSTEKMSLQEATLIK